MPKKVACIFNRLHRLRRVAGLASAVRGHVKFEEEGSASVQCLHTCMDTYVVLSVMRSL